MAGRRLISDFQSDNLGDHTSSCVDSRSHEEQGSLGTLKFPEALGSWDRGSTRPIPQVELYMGKAEKGSLGDMLQEEPLTQGFSTFLML